MATPLFMSIGADAGGFPATYLSLGAVLSFLVLLTLWREMSTNHGSTFFQRSFSILAFVGSRVLVVVFTAPIVAEYMSPPVMFVFLNLASLALAAEHLPKTVTFRFEKDSSERENRIHDHRRSAYFQTAIFALCGGLLYCVVPGASDVTFTFTGLVNSILVAATLRLSIYLIVVSRNSARQLRWVTVSLYVALTVSWLAVVCASLTRGAVSLMLLQAARGADIFSLIAGLLSLQSRYLIQGFYHKNRADSHQEAAEKAQAELSLLSRVASDIYEDSSSMIKRQQGHSRDLMRRISDLEKILQIGLKMQGKKDLRELLQMVAEETRQNLGFNTVIVRLLNERTRSFETRAIIGVNKDKQSAVMNHRLPLSEYKEMTDTKDRISNSYLIMKESPVGEDAQEAVQPAVTLGDQWDDIERLIVPLSDDSSETPVGYISVEESTDADASVVEAIENLETIARLVVVAIRNAEHYREVGEKNQKLKTYANKLSGLNQLKSNFVASISHEFRTPLTSISAYSETLLKNADNVDRDIMKEFLTVIGEESNRLMTLIEDILDFSQMESGAIKFERTPCDLRDVVENASNELKRNFSRKNITLRKFLPDTPTNVRAESELMKQLLVNLLHNAAKFTSENGNVSVSLEDESVSVRIVVEDDGIGIPEDQIESIFEHFHQGDGTSTREYGGTGIGLAIVRNIVEWHDGKIWVESVPGRGARFVVVIPKKQVVIRDHVLKLSGTMRRYEVERYLECLIEMVAELMNVKKASIMLLDEEQRELRIECAIGVDEEIVENARVKVGEGIAGKVVEEDRPYLVKDIDRDARVSLKNNDYLYDSKSFLSVPIKKNGQVFGVINVANPIAKETFGVDDCRLLEVFSDRVSLAIDRLVEFADATRVFEDVRNVVKAMVDTKRFTEDQYRVALIDVLRETGQRLGMTDREAAVLQYTFTVCDLGLTHSGYLAIKQPRDLDRKNRADVERHTIVGTEMLEPIEKVSSVRDAVLYHHENFDGSGYPGQLSGEEIPLDARIIRVADTFRALTSHRPYQRQHTVAESVDLLRKRAGTHFDPKVTEVFIEVVLENARNFGEDELEVPVRHVEEVAAYSHSTPTTNS